MRVSRLHRLLTRRYGLPRAFGKRNGNPRSLGAAAWYDTYPAQLTVTGSAVTSWRDRLTYGPDLVTELSPACPRIIFSNDTDQGSNAITYSNADWSTNMTLNRAVFVSETRLFREDTTANNTHRARWGRTLMLPGRSYRLELVAKYAGRNIGFDSNPDVYGADSTVVFHLQEGTYTAGAGAADVEMAALDDGWYRCAATLLRVGSVSTTDSMTIGLASGDSFTYSGDGASGALVDSVTLRAVESPKRTDTQETAIIRANINAVCGYDTMQYRSSGANIITGEAANGRALWADNNITLFATILPLFLNGYTRRVLTAHDGTNSRLYITQNKDTYTVSLAVRVGAFLRTLTSKTLMEIGVPMRLIYVKSASAGHQLIVNGVAEATEADQTGTLTVPQYLTAFGHPTSSEYYSMLGGISNFGWFNKVLSPAQIVTLDKYMKTSLKIMGAPYIWLG